MTSPRTALCLATFGLTLALLFARLGHAPLWDDEANTALFAESVWRTGDMDARLGGFAPAPTDTRCRCFPWSWL